PVHEAHERSVRVGPHPGEDRPRDDDPDVHDDDHVEQTRHRTDEVAGDEHYFGPCPSSRERWVARSTALMNVVRSPPSSSAAIPAMVVPPGELTMSLSAPGCSPGSRRSFAARSPAWGGGAVAI